jgi:triosephosphate isomerase
VRRPMDIINSRKVHPALEAGPRPILLVGELRDERHGFEQALWAQLPQVLADCDAAHVSRMALVREPDWTSAMAPPAPPEHVATPCEAIRQLLAETYAEWIAEAVPIIYGGSVIPKHAQDLLETVNVDGLGATRRGRQVESFAQTMRLIARSKASHRK